MKMPRKMHRTTVLVEKHGKMEKTTFLEVTTWSEEWTGRVQKVFETETHALLQTGTDGHPRVWQNVEEDPSPGRR